MRQDPDRGRRVAELRKIGAARRELALLARLTILAFQAAESAHHVEAGLGHLLGQPGLLA